MWEFTRRGHNFPTVSCICVLHMAQPRGDPGWLFVFCHVCHNEMVPQPSGNWAALSRLGGQEWADQATCPCSTSLLSVPMSVQMSISPVDFHHSFLWLSYWVCIDSDRGFLSRGPTNKLWSVFTHSKEQPRPHLYVGMQNSILVIHKWAWQVTGSRRVTSTAGAAPNVCACVCKHNQVRT